VYQGSTLVDNLLVIHNVNAGHLGRWSLVRALLSLLWPLERQEARRALEQLGIADKLYARTGHLSGGEQQRVALARVLVQKPVAVLADEPIAHLDPARRREIMDLLRDLCAGTGKTLITSFHSVGFLRTHFQRVIGMREGRIVFDRPAGEMDARCIADLYRIDHPSGDSNRPAARAFGARPENSWTLAAGE
jgi:phosphonate transport system ATP-binding protein